MENEEIGKYLADAEGMALYYFRKISQIQQTVVANVLKTGLPSMQKTLKFLKALTKMTSAQLLVKTLMRNRQLTKAIRFTTL